MVAKVFVSFACLAISQVGSLNVKVTKSEHVNEQITTSVKEKVKDESFKEIIDDVQGQEKYQREPSSSGLPTLLSSSASRRVTRGAIMTGSEVGTRGNTDEEVRTGVVQMDGKTSLSLNDLLILHGDKSWMTQDGTLLRLKSGPDAGKTSPHSACAELEQLLENGRPQKWEKLPDEYRILESVDDEGTHHIWQTVRPDKKKPEFIRRCTLDFSQSNFEKNGKLTLKWRCETSNDDGKTWRKDNKTPTRTWTNKFTRAEREDIISENRKGLEKFVDGMACCVSFLCSPRPAGYNEERFGKYRQHEFFRPSRARAARSRHGRSW